VIYEIACKAKREWRSVRKRCIEKKIFFTRQNEIECISNGCRRDGCIRNRCGTGGRFVNEYHYVLAAGHPTLLYMDIERDLLPEVVIHPGYDQAQRSEEEVS